MKRKLRSKLSTKFFSVIVGGFLLVSIIGTQSAQAAFDHIYFSINGDTTVSVMTQGDEIGFGSNCELGATIQWEIWFDINSNSIIDPSIDGVLMSEHYTDGNLISDDSSTPDGLLFDGTFVFSPEAGTILFRATDLATDSSIQTVLTVNAMVSPPNQFTGQITLPGITPPNSILANRVIDAEADNETSGFAIGLTDINGNFTLNLGATSNGIEYFINAQDFEGFVAPNDIAIIANGIVGNNNFVFTTAVDSVYGFVKNELGTVIPFESDISVSSGMIEKYTSTQNGRYVFYFSNAEKGNWTLQHNSRNAPIYLNPKWLQFSHDTLGSFTHDFTLRSTNSVIYAKITENGGLPVNNYGVLAFSDLLNGGGEAVTDIGSNNIVAIPVSSTDASGWSVEVKTWDKDYPIPPGFVSPGRINNVSPGDTVAINLITGHSISGTLTQDVGDGAIVWDNIWVGSNFSGTSVNIDGTFEYFTNSGSQSVSPFSDGYITNPQVRNLNVSSPITGVDFIINASHSTVSGTLTNVTLPLDASMYVVTARTGTDGTDGYMVFANVDSVTGTYTMDLCDGNWTIIPPCCLSNVQDADSAVVVIAEAPADAAVTVDFAYSSLTGINDDIINIPKSFTLNQNYPNPFNPTTIISFALPTKSYVEIFVYNALGQKVKTLLNQEVVAGLHSITWDGTNEAGNSVSTGMYLYKIITNNFVASKKMLLLK